MQKAAAVNGVATSVVPPSTAPGVKILVQPISATGTGTVTARDSGSEDFQAVYDSAGAAQTVDLSGGDVTVTISVSGLTAVRVTSDQTADTFTVLATPKL